ncbi:MAG TPA: ATP-binding protein [Rubrivivax sp.]|nr:ATP-binding protein [Rubrivivax sp.]
MPEAFVVGLLGAESTGKTVLAQALAQALRRSHGLDAAWVAEWLRPWCEQHGRTPRRDEQAGIAATQSALIEQAARRHEIVIADTTALMTAVYSHIVFGDDSLDATAVVAHRRCQLTLLTGLDMPWEPDGLQREGPHVRAPVDARVRRLLDAHGIGYSLVLGSGEQRLQGALQAILHHLARRERSLPPAPAPAGGARRATAPSGLPAAGSSPA